MPTLYELADARDLLDRLIEEQDGELTPELEQALDDLGDTARGKIERVALYIKEREGDMLAIHEEEKRLQKRRHAVFNATQSLRTYLLRNMQRLAIEKVNGLLVSVAVRENAMTVEGDLPPEQLQALHESGAAFVKVVPQTYTLDRRALFAHARAGGALPEGLVAVQEPSVAIR
jgi:hypothetical protein